MSKLVEFDIGEGNFEQGFRVTLYISEEGKLRYKEHRGSLPLAPELPELYRQWQQSYYGLESMRRVIKVPPAQITNVSNCENAAKALEDCVKEWFDRSSLLKLRGYVLDEVGRNESARIIFETEDELLRKLPWHLWDLFERRPNVEFSISAGCAPQTPALKRPVKILAILGGNEGIDTTEDLDLLKKLPKAKVTLLQEPRREQLNDRLGDQPWDILFFAGHSSSQEGGTRGVIQLNDTESLSLTQLRYALEQALRNGLKLAIFNSCDGLGLANELADMEIPQAIVMREPVPDRVAQKFLRYFLKYFSRGESFYLAVRRAREKLQGMEGEFPCASWLPVIFQNPSEKSPIWPRSAMTRLQTKIRLLWRSDKVAILGGGAIAVAITVAIAVAISSHVIPPGSSPKPPNPASPPGIASHMSLGEKLLIKQNASGEKKIGIQAFSEGKFDEAIKYFIRSLRTDKNDPEALIYLNNAIAQQRVTTNTGEKLVIAPSVPIGWEEKVAAETLRGVAQAQSELNCGLKEISRAIEDTQHTLNCHDGINGKLLQVEIADDEDKPDLAQQVAKAFVDDHQNNILGVIGHHSSDTTMAAGSIYEQNHLVVISSTSTSSDLTDFNEYVFRTVPSDAIAAQNLVNYIKKLEPVNVAVAYDPESAYSRSLKKEFQNRLPSRKFVCECSLSPGSSSSGECVNRAKQQKAKVMLLVPGTKGSLDKALGVINNSTGELKLLGGDAMYNSRTLQDSGKAAAQSELVVAIPWYGPNSDFAQKAKKLWTGEVNWRTATAYDATQAIIKGLRSINGSPDRKQLRQALSRPNFSADSATGKVEFDQFRDRKLSPNVGVLVQVQPDPGSNLRYKFALPVATTEF
jgi:branched-chain amino acid transport system substrate-binding protein